MTSIGRVRRSTNPHPSAGYAVSSTGSAPNTAHSVNCARSLDHETQRKQRLTRRARGPVYNPRLDRPSAISPWRPSIHAASSHSHSSGGTSARLSRSAGIAFRACSRGSPAPRRGPWPRRAEGQRIEPREKPGQQIIGRDSPLHDQLAVLVEALDPAVERAVPGDRGTARRREHHRRVPAAAKLSAPALLRRR